MTYAIRLEDLLDSARVDTEEMVQSAPARSTNGLPRGAWRCPSRYGAARTSSETHPRIGPRAALTRRVVPWR